MFYLKKTVVFLQNLSDQHALFLLQIACLVPNIPPLVIYLRNIPSPQPSVYLVCLTSREEPLVSLPELLAPNSTELNII